MAFHIHASKLRIGDRIDGYEVRALGRGTNRNGWPTVIALDAWNNPIGEWATDELVVIEAEPSVR